jgi:hypothetical protein
MVGMKENIIGTWVGWLSGGDKIIKAGMSFWFWIQ